MDENFITEATNLLAVLGYTLKAYDNWFLELAYNNEVQNIKNNCNVDTVPDSLYYVLLKRVVGYFLFALKGSGGLDGYDFEAAVKSIQEGDISITYSDGSMTPEQRFDAVIASLRLYGADELNAHRKIKW